MTRTAEYVEAIRDEEWVARGPDVDERYEVKVTERAIWIASRLDEEVARRLVWDHNAVLRIHKAMDANEWDSDLWDEVANEIIATRRPRFRLPEEDDDDDVDAMQRAEMRMESFMDDRAAGLRPGTTEGWYDDPPEMDPFDEARLDAQYEAEQEEGGA